MLVNLVEVGFSAVVESCWLVEEGVMNAVVEEGEEVLEGGKRVLLKSGVVWVADCVELKEVDGIGSSVDEEVRQEAFEGISI